MLTLKEVQDEYDQLYNRFNIIGKIQLKCWLYYAKSRNENDHDAIDFSTYCKMIGKDYVNFVKLDMIDYSDIGDKQYVLQQIS
jgi:hypothetical protein